MELILRCHQIEEQHKLTEALVKVIVKGVKRSDPMANILPFNCGLTIEHTFRLSSKINSTHVFLTSQTKVTYKLLSDTKLHKRTSTNYTLIPLWSTHEHSLI